jgi:hypothetical protein
MAICASALGRTRFSTLLIAVAVWLIGLPGLAVAQEPKAAIYVLVDLSASWLAPEAKAQNERILQVVGDAIVEYSKQARPPILVRYLGIGDRSLLRAPLCEIVFEPKLIALPFDKKTGVAHSTKYLGQYFDDCARFVLARPQAKYTDIGDALDSVRRLGVGSETERTEVLILSDMKEELRSNQSAPPLALPHQQVLIIYRALDADRGSPRALDARLDYWRERLSQAGAKVQEVSDIGVTVNQLARILLSK